MPSLIFAAPSFGPLHPGPAFGRAVGIIFREGSGAGLRRNNLSAAGLALSLGGNLLTAVFLPVSRRSPVRANCKRTRRPVCRYFFARYFFAVWQRHPIEDTLLNKG